MDKQHFNAIKDAISSFCKINFIQKSLETKKETGLFCSVLTEVKKDESMERIKQIIADLKLPLKEVTESGLERTRHFIIKVRGYYDKD